MTTSILSVHADWRCAHSGACCSMGWKVHVEPAVEDGLRRALASGALQPASRAAPFQALPDLPDGSRVVLGHDACGRCVFLEHSAGRLCAVHRQLGPEALPASCAHFPRVATLRPDGVHVTLSHFCPTAARLLLREQPVTLERSVPASPPGRPPEGLDARRGWGPLLRPGVLMGFDVLGCWEAHVLDRVQRATRPEQVLDGLVADAEALRRWSPVDGPLGARLQSICASPDPGREDPGWWSWARACSLRELAIGAVPAGYAPPALPSAIEQSDRRWVRDEWPRFAGPIRRYLAARAHGSWLSLQGEGVRAATHALLVALATLRVEAARACGAQRQRLDAELLVEALRAADLLLVHLISPEAFARRLSTLERRPSSESATPI